MGDTAQKIIQPPPQSAKERGDRLQAKFGNGATARISRERLEREMDRPPNPKPKRWRSIYSKKKRTEALYLRQSLSWPICMEYAVLTTGLLGLTRHQAMKQGLRVGEDQGVDTIVLGEDNWPLPMQQVHAAAVLGLAPGNVSVTLNWMLATKRYAQDGKRVYTVSDPPELTQEEREKVIEIDNFLDLPEGASRLPKEDIALLKSIADPVIKIDIFRQLLAIQIDKEKELEVLRLKMAERRKVIHLEARNLIDISPLSSLPNTVRPSVREEKRFEAATNGRTELIPLIVEELRHIGEVFPKWAQIDNPAAAAKTIAEACDYDKDTVTAVFQSFAASVRESDKNIKSAVGLLIARARRFQQGRSMAAGTA
jgi:hypothetical protein